MSAMIWDRKVATYQRFTSLYEQRYEKFLLEMEENYVKFYCFLTRIFPLDKITLIQWQITDGSIKMNFVAYQEIENEVSSLF